MGPATDDDKPAMGEGKEHISGVSRASIEVEAKSSQTLGHDQAVRLVLSSSNMITPNCI